MGNCIFLPFFCNKIIVCDEDEDHGGAKTLRVVAMDGEIIEYRDPILVRKFLLGFHGCGIVSSGELDRNLPKDHEMQVGQLYYLVPLPEERDCNSSKKGNQKRSSRITLVVTKKQLLELVRNAQWVGEVMSNLPAAAVKFDSPGMGNRSFVKPWTPILGTIHEECVEN